MKHFFFLFAIVAFLIPWTSKAATVTPGTLVKASGSAVYYFADDGKRYVFPTQKTYFTWYMDFSSIVTIPDEELSQIPIGGNVTYRPGVRLVKVTSDPKVYAIDGSQLRWVTTEAIARALFGDDWAQQVDDIPDPFFVNYEIGSFIDNASQYVPVSVRSTTPSIRELLTRRRAAETARTTVPTPEPKLTIARVADVPPEGKLYMGDAHARVFCISLLAQNADFSVYPPLMRIEPLGDGKLQTYSTSGGIISFPSLEAGGKAVQNRSKVTPTARGGIEMDQFRRTDSRLLVKEGAPETLCLYAEIADWSGTPEDFFGKPFRVEMDAWRPEDAIVQYADGRTETPLDTSRLSAAAALVGDPFIVTTESGVPPTKYTGDLYLEAASSVIVEDTLLPDERNVPVLGFQLRADGAGACVDRMQFTVQPGEEASASFDYLYIREVNGVRSYPDRLDAAGAWNFSYGSGSPLACLEGGETRVYVVETARLEGAVTGEYTFEMSPSDFFQSIGSETQGATITGRVHIEP